MAEMSNFTQPDNSPTYFIEFLEFLDNHADIKKLRAETAKRMNVVTGSKVLDVGCGIGGATFPIADIAGPTGLAAGIDISSAMIEVAKRGAGDRPGLEFRVSDACAIPYPDGFFDAAHTERLFLYLPDRLAAIHEMKRVVKPGGRICLVDTDIDSTALYSKKPALTRKMTSIVAASMPNPNSARELAALGRQAGLKDMKIETFAIATPHEFFMRAIAASLLKAAADGSVPHSEVDEFLTEQSSLHASGDFFQTWLFVLVNGAVCRPGSFPYASACPGGAIDPGLGVTYTCILWFRVNSSPAWPLFESLGS
jgi:ubiquinone/menaquinone biosynthesis C-methylase UbiE